MAGFFKGLLAGCTTGAALSVNPLVPVDVLGYVFVTVWAMSPLGNWNESFALLSRVSGVFLKPVAGRASAKFGVPFVAVDALHSASFHDGDPTSPHVFGMGDRLKMIRVNARGSFAQVVKLKAFWNLALGKPVGESVSRLAAFTNGPEGSVPSFGLGPSPQPARLGFLNLGKEAFRESLHGRIIPEGVL